MCIFTLVFGGGAIGLAICALWHSKWLVLIDVNKKEIMVSSMKQNMTLTLEEIDYVNKLTYPKREFGFGPGTTNRYKDIYVLEVYSSGRKLFKLDEDNDAYKKFNHLMISMNKIKNIKKV